MPILTLCLFAVGAFGIVLVEYGLWTIKKHTRSIHGLSGLMRGKSFEERAAVAVRLTRLLSRGSRLVNLGILISLLALLTGAGILLVKF